jgi:hypothetical protein
VAPDGKRIFVVLPGEQDSLPPAKLNFLMNLTDELQRRTSK